jgi:hypothetical protein
MWMTTCVFKRNSIVQYKDHFFAYKSPRWQEATNPIPFIVVMALPTCEACSLLLPRTFMSKIFLLHYNISLFSMPRQVKKLIK